MGDTPRYLFLVGCHRSGSTLLTLVLGAHPRVVSVGEFASFAEHALSVRDESRRCSCGAPLADCEFWRAVSDRVEAGTGWNPLREPRRRPLSSADLPSPVRLLLRAQEWVGVEPRGDGAVIRSSLDIFDAALEEAHARLVVDATKSAFRARAFLRERPTECLVLHLVRDGRAVARSLLGDARGTNRWASDVESAARHWSTEARRVIRALRSVPRDRQDTVQYEQFCRAPKETLERICAFAGLPFDASMLDFGSASQHVFAGNRMRLAPGSEIRPDERWRNDFGPEEIAAFDRVAGGLNRELGYV